MSEKELNQPLNQEGVNVKKQKKNYGKEFLNYLIKTTNGMAYGLFSTLIVGVIIGQIGELTHLAFLVSLGSILKSCMGVGIGIGIGTSLGLTPIQLLSCGIAGAVGGSFGEGAYKNNPLVIYVVVVLSIEITRKIILHKKTPVDIILIPIIVSLLAYGIGYCVNFPLGSLMEAIGNGIAKATEVQPLLMGIIISVVMGMCLTLPISSVAIAVTIQLGGIAAGAAVVGCSVQMIGFAIQSIRDNNVGKVISIGIGTSMLEFKNILKNPLIWIPTILTSAILGPIATCVFHLSCTSVGAGMGTCGLVGQLGTLQAMGYDSWIAYLGIVLLELVLPAVLVFVFDIIMRKFNWIKKGDLTI